MAELNGLARDRLRQAGELGPDQVVQAERGERAMAAGDQLMFLRNERGLGAGPGGRGGVAVKNGTLGTVLAVDSKGERLTVRLDGPGQEGKDGAPVVTFYLRDYGHVDHGYAATIHKAQGVTVDRAHVLASAHMDRHAAYVALTRHRDGVSLHYGRDEFADGRALARTLGRKRAKDVTLDYGAAYAERRGLDPLRLESEIVVQRGPVPEAAAPKPPAGEQAGLEADTPRRARTRAAVQRALGWHEAQGQARQGGATEPGTERASAESAPDQVPMPLLPAHRGAWGQDSQGRGTTEAEIAAAVARDAGVRRCRGELGVWVNQAYRDPNAAWERLAVLEAAEGGPKGAERALRRHDGGPELLGELRGKAGWFASAASKAERGAAVRCAQAAGSGLVRLREAEKRAGQGYVRDVEAQRMRDAVQVPGLSPAAWAAVRVVEQAGDAAEREAKARPDYNAAWGSLMARQSPAVAAELRAVVAAAGRRLREDGVRDLVRGARGAQDGRGQREGLAGIGRALAASGEGQRAHAAVQERAREAERERLGPRQGRGLRM